MNSLQQDHAELVAQVAEQYQQEGYTVYVEPHPHELPFSLGSYQPDLLAMRSANEGVIIEVKNKAATTAVGRLRAISETVAEHDGWRFLLVTGDTAVPNAPIAPFDQSLPTWEQIVSRYERGVALHKSGEVEGALVILWGALEGVLRKQAEQTAIPIERFPLSSLINHLYSEGELSMAQFDVTLMLSKVRHQVVHGFEVENAAEASASLQTLIEELIALWLPPEASTPTPTNGASPPE